MSEKNNILIDESKKVHDLYWTMVVHDMKGPVQAELSALKILMRDENVKWTNDQREMITGLFTSAQYLQTLVTNLLQKEKLDYGKIKIKKELNSFKRLISECCEELKYTAFERNIGIKVFYESNIDFLQFDYNEMKRVIQNLLTNAIKHSFQNKDIIITVKNKRKKLVVEVKNTGIGINIKNPDDIFNKFTSYCEKNKSIHFGLGLYISKQIISQHDGTIKFDCIPNKHTTITFTLPTA